MDFLVRYKKTGTIAPQEGRRKSMFAPETRTIIEYQMVEDDEMTSIQLQKSPAP